MQFAARIAAAKPTTAAKSTAAVDSNSFMQQFCIILVYKMRLVSHVAHMTSLPCSAVQGRHDMRQACEPVCLQQVQQKCRCRNRIAIKASVLMLMDRERPIERTWRSPNSGSSEAEGEMEEGREKEGSRQEETGYLRSSCLTGGPASEHSALAGHWHCQCWTR